MPLFGCCSRPKRQDHQCPTCGAIASNMLGGSNTKDIAAGPIYSDSEALTRCPTVCQGVGAGWDRQWTSANGTSFCGCNVSSKTIADSKLAFCTSSGTITSTRSSNNTYGQCGACDAKTKRTWKWWIDPTLTSTGFSQSQLQQACVEAFQRWAWAIPQFTFSQQATEGTADIKITKPDQWNTAAFDTTRSSYSLGQGAAPSGCQPTNYAPPGTVWLNPSPTAWSAANGGYLCFRRTLTHEIGHAFGLNNLCSGSTSAADCATFQQNSIMSGSGCGNSYDAVWSEDVRMIKKLYGL